MTANVPITSTARTRTEAGERLLLTAASCTKRFAGA